VDYFELDPHPAAVNPIVINNKSPVPNSAIVFVNWLTSLEGQTVFGQGDYIPVHPDAPFEGAPGVYPNPNYEVETIVPTTERIETISSVWQDVMSEILPG
ncbi:MAG: hypothetical protein R3324_04835, partial [Halobacteriales archaeon]|nr:hypothetical protein [Halobacteriales archaeon]